jgi:biopolymer transport protein ExbD
MFVILLTLVVVVGISLTSNCESPGPNQLNTDVGSRSSVPSQPMQVTINAINIGAININGNNISFEPPSASVSQEYSSSTDYTVRVSSSASSLHTTSDGRRSSQSSTSSETDVKQLRREQLYRRVPQQATD